MLLAVLPRLCELLHTLGKAAKPLWGLGGTLRDLAAEDAVGASRLLVSSLVRLVHVPQGSCQHQKGPTP